MTDLNIVKILIGKWLMKIKLAAPVQLESLIDGPGIRMVIWNQGCQQKCYKCHNPETWDINGGNEYDTEDIKKIIKEHASTHQGITLTGGDPFLQPRANKEIADYAHSLGLNVWAYCGMKWELLKILPPQKELLDSCDFLVDGPYIDAERDLTLRWRGSRNQNIINLKTGEIEND